MPTKTRKAPKEIKLTLADTQTYAQKLSEALRSGLHLRVVESGFSGKYFIELRDRNGRVEDLALCAGPDAVFAYLSAFEDALRITGRVD
jgi:hypothetical protein